MRLALRLSTLLLAALFAAASDSALAQSGPVLFVDADATGAADGSSWADAFPYLQQALAIAAAGDEVWVAEGTYRPTDGGDPTDRTATFLLPDGVALYGGFDGTEAEREERDWNAHVSVLSGELGDPDSFFDDSYHVVTAPGAAPTTILDGLTIEGASANADDFPDDRGGGLLSIGGSPTLRNCTFAENGAFQRGGAVYVGSGSPLIEDCHFEGNVANVGGAVFATGGEPVIRRTTFRGNNGGAVGLWEGADALIEDALFEENELSALRIRSSSPVVRRTTLRSNSCGPSCGGGAYLQGSGAPLFEDCLFEGNTGVGGGGAVYAAGATPAFVRTTFRENVNTGDSGGAVYLSEATSDAASPALFLGCRFERNRGTSGGGLFAFGTALAVVNTVFVGNRATLSETGRGGAVFVNTAPATAPGGGPGVAFANVVVAGNEGRDGGGLLLANLPGAARLVNATVAGNRSLGVGGGVSTFEAGGLSFENSILWGNEVPEGAEGGVALFHEAGEGPTVERSIVEGGCPVAVDCEGVLDADPLFARSPHPGGDGAWGTADDDYGSLRLVEGSPGVDAGLASLLPADRWDLDGDGDTAEPLPLDVAGDPRVVGAEVDLGAYEGTVPVSTEGAPSAGGELTLSAYPNPSRGAVTLALDVPGTDRVRVALYDVLGREVAVLHDGPLAAGSHRLAFDGADLPTGVYLVRATGDGFDAAQRVTVVR
jgi:predicted outer membrane repeat protein